MIGNVINSILPIVILAGVIVSVISIIVAVSLPKRESIQKTYQFIDRINKINDEYVRNINEIKSILSLREKEREIFSSGEIQDKLEQVIRSMDASSAQLVSITNELIANVPIDLEKKILPRAKEAERKVSSTRNEINILVSSINRRE